MTKLERKLRYNGFTGPIYSKSNGSLCGEVEGIEKNNHYSGKTFEELEQQFKNRINYFYELHAAVGIKPQQSKKNHLFILVLALLFLSSFGVIWYLWVFYINEMPIVQLTKQAESAINIKMEWWDKASSFINNLSAPTLSFLSFTALLYTIHQQNKSHRLSLKELALTREELEMTRKEIEKTTIANQEQADALKNQVIEAQNRAIEQRQLAQEQQRITQVQQFENTFFSLLANHERSLTKITESNNGLISIADTALIRLKEKRVNEKKYHLNFFEYNDITSYFIVLYQMLKLMKQYPHLEDISDEEKLLIEKKYTSLIRAYIPKNVLMLILFNCVVVDDDDDDDDHKCNNFKEYRDIIENYAFLEHVSFKFVIHIDARKSTIDLFESSFTNVLTLIANTYSFEKSAFGYNINIVKDSIDNIVRYHFNKIIHDKLKEKGFFNKKDVLDNEINMIENHLYEISAIALLYEKVNKVKLNLESDLRSKNKEQQVCRQTLNALRTNIIRYYSGDIFPTIGPDFSGRPHYFKEDEIKLVIKNINVIQKELGSKLLTKEQKADKNNEIKLLRNKIKDERACTERSIIQSLKENNSGFDLNKKGILFSELKRYIDNK